MSKLLARLRALESRTGRSRCEDGLPDAERICEKSGEPDRDVFLAGESLPHILFGNDSYGSLDFEKSRNRVECAEGMDLVAFLDAKERAARMTYFVDDELAAG